MFFLFLVWKDFISGREMVFVSFFFFLKKKNKFLLYLLRSVLSYPGMLHHFNFIIVYISIVLILQS